MSAAVLAFFVGAVLSLVLVVMVLRRSRALRRRQRSVLTSPVVRPGRASVLPSLGVGRLPRAVVSGPRWLALSLAFGGAASLGYVLGGVVAGVAAGVYGMVGAVIVRRRRVAVARRAARSALLDRLTGLAADLRAGLPVQSATQAAALGGGVAGLPRTAGTASPGEGLVVLAQAATTLAERTGAPLADLIDRIEADARAGDRARAAATAQAAGAQATAFLLAALPVGGLALGYAIGADPLAILLGTPLGAVCALGAVALQILGLTWSQRLQPALS